MELPKDIITAFNKAVFSKLYKKNGTIYVNNISIQYEYINKGGECKVYGVTFYNGKRTYKNLVVKIVYKINQKEHNIMKLCSDNVKNGTTVNFIQLFSFKCEGEGCVYLLERVQANMETWLNTSHPIEEWKSFMAQILFGLDFLYSNKICHRDLKPKNILYKKLDNLTTITYKNYKLLTDTIFYITDFGHSETINLGNKILTETEIELCILNHTDFYYIETIIKRIKVSYIIKIYTLEQLVEYAKDRNDDNIDAYIENETRNICRIQSLHSCIKDSLLLKSVAYYIIEKHDMDFSTFPQNIIKWKLPPPEADELLTKVFSSKDSIDYLITTYFIND